MKNRLKRMAFWSLGWGFILLGIAGIFLPILQGILFILIGLSLLSTVSPRAERLLIKIRERFPRISGTYDEAKVRAKSWQEKLSKKFNEVKAKKVPGKAVVSQDENDA